MSFVTATLRFLAAIGAGLQSYRLTLGLQRRPDLAAPALWLFLPDEKLVVEAVPTEAVVRLAAPIPPAAPAAVMATPAVLDSTDTFDWSRVRHPAHHDLAPGAALPAAWAVSDERVRTERTRLDTVLAGFFDEELVPVWQLAAAADRYDLLFA